MVGGSLGELNLCRSTLILGGPFSSTSWGIPTTTELIAQKKCTLDTESQTHIANKLKLLP